MCVCVKFSLLYIVSKKKNLLYIQTSLCFGLNIFHMTA